MLGGAIVSAMQQYAGAAETLLYTRFQIVLVRTARKFHSGRTIACCKLQVPPFQPSDQGSQRFQLHNCLLLATTTMAAQIDEHCVHFSTFVSSNVKSPFSFSRDVRACIHSIRLVFNHVKQHVHFTLYVATMCQAPFVSDRNCVQTWLRMTANR